MKIEINTKEDSADDIRKAIKLLQIVIGDLQEPQSAQPFQASDETNNSSQSFNNIFNISSEEKTQDSSEQEQLPQQKQEAASESTEDLFAELFSDDEIKQMKKVEDEEPMPKGKKHKIELY